MNINENAFWDKVSIPRDVVTGCWEWTAWKGRWGYGHFRAGNKSVPAHRASFFLFNGHVSDVPVVRHACDNTGCVNPLHLLGGDVRDNTKDRVLRGRGAVGEKQGLSRLTNALVLHIHGLLSAGLSQRYIARAVGVSRSTIQQVSSGTTWRHLEIVRF